ncbi:MAG: hypothetical protein AAGD07_18170 [Planctomycetota bacterium]
MSDSVHRVLPLGLFAIVGCWTTVQTIGVRYAGVTVNVGMGAICGALAAGWILVPQWWLTGDCQTEDADESRRLRWRFRWGITTVLMLQMILVGTKPHGGPLLGQFLVWAVFTLSGLLLYRQLTGRLLSLNATQRAAAFDIRGLMALTTIVAMALAVAIWVMPIDTARFQITMLVGVLCAPTWLAMNLWLLGGRWPMLLISLVMIPVTIALSLAAVYGNAAFDTEQSYATLAAMIALFAQSLLYLGLGRATDMVWRSEPHPKP